METYVELNLLDILTVMIGSGVIISCMYRVWRLDIKINKCGYVALHLLTMLAAWLFIAGNSWGPLLLLAAVALQHLLTAKGWRDRAPDITLRASK